MAEETNKIKQNIKNMALYALNFSNKTRTFKELEREFNISKKEAVNILNLFNKKKLANYHFVSSESSDIEAEDPFNSKLKYENQTAGFKLFFNPLFRRGLELEKGLYKKVKGKRVKDEIVEKQLNLIAKAMDVYDKTGQRKKEVIKAKKDLKKLIDSKEYLNSFIKKNQKFLKIEIINSGLIRNIGSLKINLTTGDFTYFKSKGSFNPKGQEYKVLYVLIKSPNNKLSYSEIISKTLPHLNPKSTSDRTYLHKLIQKIHIRLGVLPIQKGKKKNKRLIHGIKNWGYELK